MKPKLTIRKAINIIKKIKPNNVEDLEAVLPFNFIGNGSFREVYEIGKLGIVIKFPLEDRWGDGNLDHAQTEIRNIKLISDKIPKLKPYLPKVYYTKLFNGVIVMKKYKPLEISGARTKAAKAFYKYMNGNNTRYNYDMSHDNLGKDKNGNVVYLDLGYVKL